jgi:hypothetical protein
MTTAIGNAAPDHTTTTNPEATTYIESAMCIGQSLDYFGRSSGPVAVYCAVTLTVLGKTDGGVERNCAGQIAGRFGGCAFVANKHPTSRWFTLAFIAPDQEPDRNVRAVGAR